MKLFSMRLAKDSLALLLLIPVIFLVGFSTFAVSERFGQYRHAEEMSKVIGAVVAINRLIHELQIERGATGGYIVNRNSAFKDILEAQYERVGAAWRACEDYLREEGLAVRNAGIADSLMLLEQKMVLETMRNAARNGTGEARSIIWGYSRIIENLLTSIDGVTKRERAYAELSEAIISYSALLHIKENAGMERAASVIAYEGGGLSGLMVNDYLEFIARQKAFKEVLDVHASPVQHRLYRQTLDAPVVERVEDFRSALLLSISGVVLPVQSSSRLFEIFTRKINLLKQVEDGFVDELRSDVADIKNGATQSLTKMVAVIVVTLLTSFLVLVEVEKRAAALDLSKRMALEASRTKSVFLSRMSHELRTPLNAIIGFSQFLKENEKDPLSIYQREYVDHVAAAGEHLLELVNDILDLAKLESGKSEISIENIYPSTVLEDCIVITEPIAQRRGITVRNELTGEMDSMVAADVLRLKQIFLNLLSNAVKYNREGGSITVSGYKTLEDRLHIAVTDTGIGIPASRYAEVFEPFDRLGVDHSHSEEGTGIGLTITKHLVEQMGGRIGFDSKEGSGTTFWFELDLASEREQVAWTDKLRVGVEAIDSDHEVLIGLLNKLGDKGLNIDGVGAVIDELIDYAEYHFRREEAIMAAYGYEGVAKHRQEHARFTERVRGFRGDWVERREPRLISEIHQYLQSWLIDHIMRSDKAAFAFIGVTEADVRTALDAVSEP